MNTPATSPQPDPPIAADETFARELHAWLDAHPPHNRRLQQAVERWLVAKGL